MNSPPPEPRPRQDLETGNDTTAQPSNYVISDSWIFNTSVTVDANAMAAHVTATGTDFPLARANHACTVPELVAHTVSWDSRFVVTIIGV
jgi:hypothetical protein